MDFLSGELLHWILDDNEEHDNPDLRLNTRPFADPKTDKEIDSIVSSVPKKTRDDTNYCIRIWNEWTSFRQQTCSKVVSAIETLSKSELQYWLQRFVLEVRKRGGTEFPPNSLHHNCSGLMRHLRQNGQHTLDFYKDPEFALFHATLDAEMKRLQGKGQGSKKRQAEPISGEEQLYGRKAFWVTRMQKPF